MKKSNRKNRKMQQKSKSINYRDVLFYSFFGMLIILLPLVYFKGGLDPSLNPRLLFVSALLFIFTPLLLFFDRKLQLNKSILRNPLLWLLFSYALITAFSEFFAINAREGNFDLSKSFMLLVLTGIGGLILFNTPQWQKKLPAFFIIPALVLVINGFYEYNEHVWQSKSAFNVQFLPVVYEVRGLMSHKNQFAIAMMMLLPFLGFGVYKFRGLAKWLSLLSMILLLALIVLIKTRSVWVGLTMSIFVVTVMLVFFGDRLNFKKQFRIILGVSFVSVILGVTLLVHFSTSHNPDSIVFKLKNITNPTDYNNIHRLHIWEITTKIIRDHPLEGVGAGNWKINAPYYYPGYDLRKDQLNWLRPHNDYLWVFAEKGILGFLIFIGIFVLTIYYLLKVFFSAAAADKRMLSLFLLAGLVSYLSVSFFSFPLERINHQVYLGLILAGTMALYHESFGNKEKIVNLSIVSIPVLLAMLFSITYSLSVLGMEVKVKRARELQAQERWPEMLELSKTIPSTFRNIDAEAMPVAWYPGLAYANLNEIEKANKAYQEAVKAHPTRIAVLNNLGRTYFQLGDYEHARDIFLQALAILPDYFESLVNVSSSYIQLKDYENAYLYLMKIPKDKMNDPLNGNLKMVKRKLGINKKK